MNLLTRIFLVALRLAIGWHFLFEGLDKIDSYFRGPVEGKTVWSSEAYLRESTGPLAPLFREQLGDPDQAALERLIVPPGKDGERPQLPPALKKDWQDYYDRFAAFYEYNDAKAFQPEIVFLFAVMPSAGSLAALPWPGLARVGHAGAKADLEVAESVALNWLLHGKREVEVTFSQVTEKVVRTTPERVRAYRAKLGELREIEEYGLRAFGRDVWKKKLTALKDEIKTTRNELLAELNRPMRDATDAAYKARLTKAQRDRGPLPEPDSKTRLWWINQITMWGITAVGTCLILGLFTRLACLGGAAFLLMVYLAMPALPWLPANPRAEGHYFFVNKNIVEMLALLMLATTQSGRWVGLDGLLRVFRTRRLRKPPAPGNKQGRGTPGVSVSHSPHTAPGASNPSAPTR
jgi:uncharacterized membrane protein YphA (DoxX/SURF4 family)